MHPDDLRSLLVGLALAGAVFVGDAIVPLGNAYAVSYTIVVLATPFSPNRWVTIVLAGVASALMMLGAFVDPPFTAPSRNIVAHRAFGLAAVWIIAWVIMYQKKVTAALPFNQEHNGAILDNMRVAFMETDEVSRIVTWNPHAHALFGWSPEEAEGRDLIETIVPEGSRAPLRRGCQSFLSSGNSSMLNRWIEIDGLRRDGETFQALVLIGALKLESGRYRFFAFLKDITERKRIERELEASYRSLAGRLISSHEEERRRLARHLHDDVSQRVAVYTEEKSPAEIRESLQRCRVQAEQLASELHEMSHRLHPAVLEQVGLVAGIQNECDRFQEVEGIEISFDSDDVSVQVPLEIALALYRSVQEGLRNVAKHSQADGVAVGLVVANGRIRLSITDSGMGFEMGRYNDRAHLGLLSMNERARAILGQFAITSAPGQGTCIEITAPLPSDALLQD